jgi:hypothetical protein
MNKSKRIWSGTHWKMCSCSTLEKVDRLAETEEQVFKVDITEHHLCAIEEGTDVKTPEEIGVHVWLVLTVCGRTSHRQGVDGVANTNVMKYSLNYIDCRAIPWSVGADLCSIDLHPIRLARLQDGGFEVQLHRAIQHV